MKTLINKLTGYAAAVVGFSTMAVTHSFAMDWTGITLDLTDVNSAFALVVPGLIAMWGMRKVVKSLNRS